MRDRGPDWTIVRPTGLRNAPPTGTIRALEDSALGTLGGSVPRIDLANFILTLIEDESTIRKSFGVSSLGLSSGIRYLEGLSPATDTGLNGTSYRAPRHGQIGSNTRKLTARSPSGCLSIMGMKSSGLGWSGRASK